MAPPIPVNIVAGPLGVGKTTTINHLLAQRPANERWAVLINEYGLIGLDAALVDGASSTTGVAVREVAGGCICCSAGPVFEVTLVQLLRRRPDRLLIEPTGLATVSGILDTLRRDGIREAVEVRSIVCLLNPMTLERDLGREEVRDQVEAADVLLAARGDLASPPSLDAFTHWVGDLFPPRRHTGSITHGALSVSILDLVRDRQVEPGTHEHGHHHHHAHTIDEGIERPQGPAPTAVSESTPVLRRHHRSGTTTTLGWVCWHGLTFDGARLERWLEGTSKLPGLRRLKAVLRTDRGWRSFNVTEDTKDEGPSAYRRDSRVELILESESQPDGEVLEDALRNCLLDA